MAAATPSSRGGSESNENVTAAPATERSPLLGPTPSGSALTISPSTIDDEETAGPSKPGRPRQPPCPGTAQPNGGVPARLRRRIALSLYIFCFLVMMGDYLQPAARTQIYEDAICYRYYAGLRPLDFDVVPPNGGGGGFPPHTGLPPPENGGGVPGNVGSPRCKIPAVQNELSLVRGFEQLSQVIPTLICAVPFGRLADRYGRRNMILFNVAGIVISEFWSISVVGPLAGSLPIRSVWGSGLVILFFGGASLTASLIHVMVADFADDADRTKIFLFMSSGSVIAGFLGPMISAALMEMDRSWTVVLVAESFRVLSILVFFFVTPETMGMRERFASSSPWSDDYISSAGPSSLPSTVDIGQSNNHGHTRITWPNPAHGKKPKSLLDRIHAAGSPVTSIFASNRQAALLLFIYIPLLSAKEVFTCIGLLFADERFHLPFSRGNVLLVIYQATQGVLMLFILPIAIPFLIRIFTSPSSSSSSSTATTQPQPTPSAWNRDRKGTVISIALVVLGHTVLGLAPTLSLATAGLVISALGQGCSSMVLSLLGAAVRPDQVSITYGLALMLSSATAGVLAPVASTLLNQGLARGTQWLGLPFLFTAMIMVLPFVGALFVRKEKEEKAEWAGDRDDESARRLMRDERENGQEGGEGEEEEEEELVW